MLLVRLVSLLLEGNLLVRVGGIPFFDQGADNVAVVLALHVGNGTAAIKVVGSVAAPGTSAAARAAPAAATGGQGQGEYAGSGNRE
jgi:hypothetical protein